MSELHSLQGSCSCGRYNYIVVIPESNREQAEIHFRTDNENRRSQAALLTAFLKVPLSWYSSSIVSFFPDETHNSISRTFSSIDEPYSQRKFCGHCGTHLSYWTEQPRDEQEFIHVTLGSLRNRDLDTLQDLDLLPEDVNAAAARDGAVTQHDANAESSVVRTPSGYTSRTVRQGRDGPITWFEEMLDGSHLGRTRKTRRGMGQSVDGATSVSWEITEYGDEDNDVVMTSSNSSSKRKLDDVADEARPVS